MPWSIWLVTDCVFEIFFDSSRSRSSMFLKSMLPPKLSWYVWSMRDAAVLEQAGEHAVHDGGADLALDVVADDRARRRPSNFCAHSGSLAMNTGMALTNADAGVEAGLRVVALRLLGADRAGSDTSTSARASRSAWATSTGSAGDSSTISR